MPKFIFAYHGGKTPDSTEAEQAAMTAWGNWFRQNADSFTDPGNPVGTSKTVSAAGVEDNGGANPLSGYGIVETDSVEAALEIAKSCPIVDEGGSIEVAPIVELEI